MNPLMLLHTHCGWSLALINQEICRYKHLDQLHKAVTAPSCPQKFQRLAFEAIMVEWGQYERLRDPRRKDLWACYFPDTRPHIYHLLHYVRNLDLSGKPTAIYHGTKQVKKGYSDRVIRGILRQPKLHLRQLDRIRRFAIQYIDELSSKNRERGVDPYYMTLHRAINDSKRLYMKGEIIID